MIMQYTYYMVVVKLIIVLITGLIVLQYVTIIFVETKSIDFSTYIIGVELLNYIANNIGTNRTFKHNLLCKFKKGKELFYIVQPCKNNY